MIPLHDNIPSRTWPVVNWTILAACGAVFFLQIQDPEGRLIEQYGMIPARVTSLTPDPLPGSPAPIPSLVVGESPPAEYAMTTPAIPASLTLLTCMFLHGGFMHFAGNMLFLWIFGDNVEDCFGHVGYLMFYLATGLVAGLTHLVTDPSSPIPTIGASGAIAGVLGGYFVLYPQARVMTLIPIPIYFRVLNLPAYGFLGFWFGMQILIGVAALNSNEPGGVAWWAHIGGFAAGWIVAMWLRSQHQLTGPQKRVVPGTDGELFFPRPHTQRAFRRSSPW